MANSSQQPALPESSANNKRKGKNPSHVAQSPNIDLVIDDNVSCTQAANIANTHAMTIREYLQDRDEPGINGVAARDRNRCDSGDVCPAAQ
eukprot:Em0007g1138a